MATLTATTTENIVLNGSQQGGTNTVSVTGINDVYKRVVTCPASNNTTVVTFGSTVHAANGNMDVENCRYIRITNLDSTNPITVGVIGATSNFMCSIEFGRSFVLSTPDGLMLAEEDVDPSFGTKEDVAAIEVNPGGNNVAVEVFVASV